MRNSGKTEEFTLGPNVFDTTVLFLYISAAIAQTLAKSLAFCLYYYKIRIFFVFHKDKIAACWMKF